MQIDLFKHYFLTNLPGNYVSYLHRISFKKRVAIYALHIQVYDCFVLVN